MPSTEEPIAPQPSDPEIDAIEACVKALLPLDSDARGRALAYLTDRFEEVE